MKKIVLMASMLVLGVLVSNGQSFQSGDCVVNIGVGAGTVKNLPYPERQATFTQKISAEWGVSEIGDKGSIGLGFAVNNGIGGKYTAYGTLGEYDYDYILTIRTQNANGGYTYNRREIEREGIGSADVDLNRNDISLLFTTSFHYQMGKRLDTYLTLGVGATGIVDVVSNVRNEQGFSAASSSFTDEAVSASYKYDDMRDVEWIGVGATVRPAVAAYVGARYYVTDHLALNAEAGLLNATLSKKYGYGYNHLSVGLSYKF